MSYQYTIPYLFNKSVENYENLPAVGFAGEEPKSYKEMKQDVNAVIAFLEDLGVQRNDKVAILSTNMPNWGVTYLAVTSMGAITVPILPDFSTSEVQNILKHSEAKVLFVSEKMLNKLNTDNGTLEHVVILENLSLYNSDKNVVVDRNKLPSGQYEVNEDDLASIIYTSGTTGKSKGVMLTHKNITYTAEKTKKIQPVHSDDRLLAILPLSHTYENTLGFILPIISGASIYYLRKPPTPAVLLPALKQVRPTLMLSVPLIIEKIYRNKVLPTFQKNKVLNVLYKVPFIRKKLNEAAGKKLVDTFGGELKFFGIGGAKLDKTVERFLREAKFPYAIGYGLTETSPLLAGCNPQNTLLQSTGKALEGVDLKINNPDAQTGEGEIWAKGPSVMKGYYKEPELTDEVFSEDGWFKTGDLGVFDENNNLFIRGRLKNMIVGDSGENIYPEDIESVINNFKHVVESLVIQKKGKLVAMVHLNSEEIEQRYKSFKGEVTNYIDKRMEELRDELHTYINSHVNRFSRVQHVLIRTQPFEKTPTHKIKRFLYT